MTTDTAHLIVRCLETEGVEYVFGIPGEENIHLVDALAESSIRYIVVRHEQGASFMAEMYGRLTGRAGVCSATLGPGAINLLLGTADATTNSTPLVAIAAQGSLARVHKESHQVIDLAAMFAPVTQWSERMLVPEAAPEMIRKAFKTAQSERPGAVFLSVPEDLEGAPVADDVIAPLPISTPRADAPSSEQIDRAAEVLNTAANPVVLAGHGAARAGAGPALTRFSETLNLAVATTFHGKGVFPDDHPNALGAVGFMRHDYTNFGFDDADVIVCVGYELQEFDPVKINPDGDKRILHLHRFPAETDAHYPVSVGIQADTSQTLDALAKAVTRPFECDATSIRARARLEEELQHGRDSDAFPLIPQRVVADVRSALGREDIVLADTGAVKMWMSRLYPTYESDTCLVSNGLSAMGFAVPGALGAKLARPGRRVLAMPGDGAFLMNSQELETAVREGIPVVVLVLVDDEYGLITWKMELDLQRHSHTAFDNPDLVTYAESFGAHGYRIDAADQLLPTLQHALADDGVSVIACPVDYSENLRLTDRLGELDEPL